MPYIVETIITSRDERGTPHAAPFGVQKEGGFLQFAPFHPSKTLENLQNHHNRAVIHYADDPMLFVGCLLGKQKEMNYEPPGRDGFIIPQAYRWQLVEVTEIAGDPNRPVVTCRVVKQENLPHRFRGFNRAFGGIVETCIALSRRRILPKGEIERSIANAKVLVEKTADKDHKAAFLLLEKFYEDWLKQSRKSKNRDDP